MSGPNLCPICQSPLTASAPDGLCPKCLWASLLDSNHEQTPPDAALGSFDSTLPVAGERLGVFGDYELLSEIARGGMGVVFKARQISLQRLVALKMILTARLPGELDMIRFRAEAEAVASMDHSNIVPIYEIADDEGHPYFTMKFIEDGTLADRLFQWSRRDASTFSDSLQTKSQPQVGPYNAREIAALIAKTAHAVHHAHQHGILHRDLKPSNILLDKGDEPLVTDFGLAKQVETESHLTMSGTVLGTPSYIAPEQAAGSKNLTSAVDIYSLGAIFYELLTAQAPFQADSPMETLRQVVEQEIPRPSSINGQVDRDLETICLKCLQKNPTDRYGSAEALAEDLERWQRREPILARRASYPERALKWTMRHPTLTAFFILALIAPVVIVAVLLSSNKTVRLANLETRQNLYAADMFLADRALREGNIGLARVTLASHVPVPGHPGGEEDFRGFEWRLLWKRSQGNHLRVLAGFPRPPSAVAIAPDGQTLAIAGMDFLWRWDLDNAAGTELLPPEEPRWLNPEEAAKLLSKVRMTPLLSNQVGSPNPTPGQISQMVNPELTDPVTALSFSPDGRQIVTSTRGHGRAARVWNMADGAIEFAFPALYSSAVMSPVAPVVAVGSSATPGAARAGCVKFYDLEQRAEIWALPESGGLVCFSGDGQSLVTVGAATVPGTSQITLWSLPERRLLKQFISKKVWNILAFSPDGRWVALAGVNSSAIEIWSVEQEHLALELVGHNGAIRALTFSPDSRLLATAGVDQIVRVWSVSSGELTATHIGHTDEIASLAFFPDGQRLASASRDATVRLWSTAASDRKTPEHTGEGVHDSLLVSPDGQWWTSTTESRTHLKVRETRTDSSPRLVALGGESAQYVGFDDGGLNVVLSVYDTRNSRIKLEWRALKDLSLSRRISLDGNVDLPLLGEPHFRAAARLFALVQSDNRVCVWSTRTGKLLQTFRLQDHMHGGTVGPPASIGVVISPNGTFLAAIRFGTSQIAVFSLPEGKLLYSRHVRPIVTLVGDHHSDYADLAFIAFSPDSKLLVSTDTTERSIRLWEARTGIELGRLSGHRDHTIEASFSPDGKTLASTGGDGSLKLWHLPTQREVATLLETGAVGPVAFSPDGSFLIVGLEDDVRIFRAPTLVEIDREPDLDIHR